MSEPETSDYVGFLCPLCRCTMSDDGEGALVCDCGFNGPDHDLRADEVIAALGLTHVIEAWQCEDENHAYLARAAHLAAHGPLVCFQCGHCCDGWVENHQGTKCAGCGTAPSRRIAPGVHDRLCLECRIAWCEQQALSGAYRTGGADG